MYRKLLASVREYKKSSLQAPFFVSLEVVMECIIPFIVAKLVNQIRAGCDFIIMLEYGVILVIMAFLSLLFGIIAGNACSTASCGFAKNLRSDLFRSIQKFSFENLDKFPTASLVTRLTTDVSGVQEAYMMIIRTVIRAPLMLIFSFIMALIMGGRIALIFLLTAPFLGGGLYFLSKLAMMTFRKIFRKYDKLNNLIQENIRGIRVVKSFVREDYEKEKFSRSAEEICNDFIRARKILVLNNPLMQFCLYIVMIFILYYGSYKVITTRGLDLNIGQISSLITYGTQILGSLMRLSMVLVIITLARESAVRIVEVLEEGEKPALTSPVNGIKEISSGEIEFIDVNFIYNSARNQQNILHESMTGTQNLSHDNDSNSNKNISGSQNFSHESMTGTQKFSHDNDSNTQNSRLYALRNINLHIESGSTIGIIGGTGSSKTTLIQLIPRLYDVTSGVIKISGHDVKEYDLNSLRNNIALVLQKNELFTGTIRDNLLWGNENATDSQIIEVCKIAHADEFIEKLPAKYNTHIEQNGTNLSGGQKQRLCIARALLKQPKILILDDSTSAVDTHTDALIRSGLKNYLPNTTKIIISQRILSVQDADKIIVMDDGEIKAVGTHKDLLKSSAIYNEIYLSQTRKELL